MAIYRGAGGAGDAINDSSSEASAAVIARDEAVAAKVAAEAARDAALTAETNAETAETNAETAETNAETAASNALTSANNASNSAVSAASSASAASSSASSASTSATNAANSSTTAAGSASAAAISATAASNSASSASGYATTASNAATSASASAASATASEAAALASKNAAATSATNAASSASTANSAATTATTQAGIATTQATNASNSASAAATSATNASNSASAAATSASNAATSATNSANSATASATSASASQAAADAALAALDSFDDRYLGQKATAPTVDNDGNPLVIGALYFDTTDDAMKVWDGSLWLAAYASLSGALLSANNLSDLSNAATARSNLGVTATGSDTTYAYRANNLSDLANAATARTNLGLGTAATTNSTAYATAAQGATADTAYADRLKWDGGATGLVAATGRTSLGLGTAATTAATDYATAAQGAKADTALQPAAIGVTVQGYDADLAAFALKTAPTGAVVGTTDTQTLTNKTISGASNTLSNIGNSSLTNSAITINGVSTSLGGSANVGTVTSVSGTAPISVATGTSTPAISISQATTSTNGYLSSTDWNTFNGKQAALVSGTNIKTVNSTSLLGSGNLAVGTVTSVSATVPTGLSISGSPITTSGTLAITYTAGYSIPTTASQTNWDSAYTQRLQWDGGSTNLVASTGRTSLGGTTVGQNFFTLTNPTAVTFPRINADNTVSALARQDAIDALAGSTTSGQYLRGNGTDVVMSAIQAADVPTLNQSTTGSAATLTTARTLAITGDLSWTSPSFNGSANVTAAGTLATVNSNVGTFGSASSIPVVTVNAKGLVTAVSTATVAGGQYFGSAATKAIAYNANTIGENVTVTAGNNGLSAGPITISTGFTVTVQTGANWVIV